MPGPSIDYDVTVGCTRFHGRVNRRTELDALVGIMRRALEYVKAFDGVIAQHAQDPRLTEGAQMNEGAVSAELGLAGWPAVVTRM